MKKILLTVALAFLLAACRSETEATEATTDSTEATEVVTDAATEVATEVAEEETETVNEDDAVGRVEESEMGKRTIVRSMKEMNEVQESGPFEVTITDIQVSDFEPSEDYKSMFEDKDKLSIVTIAVEIENKSTDTNAIYPDQGIVTTNTKEQKDVDLLLSDSVGGDYIGEVIKTGTIIALLDSPAEEIETIKYVISAPFSADTFENIGEKIIFEFDFTK